MSEARFGIWIKDRDIHAENGLDGSDSRIWNFVVDPPADGEPGYQIQRTVFPNRLEKWKVYRTERIAGARAWTKLDSSQVLARRLISAALALLNVEDALAKREINGEGE